MSQEPRRFLNPVIVYTAVGLALVLFFVFPASLRFVEAAARQLRYLWWVVLLLAFAIWLMFAFRRKR